MLWGALFTWIIMLSVATGVLVVSNLKLWVEFKALRNSTHQVTFMDPKANFESMSTEEKEKLSKVMRGENLYDNID